MPQTRTIYENAQEHVTRQTSRTLVARRGACAPQTHMIYEDTWVHIARKTSMSTALVATGPRRRLSQQDLEVTCQRRRRLCVINTHDLRGRVDVYHTQDPEGARHTKQRLCAIDT